MLVTAPIAGLQPGSLYRVEIEAEITSNVPHGCAGIGRPDGEWEIKRMTTQGQPLFVSAGDDGVLWVFAGTDSAFEGFTQYYILSLTTRLEPYEPE
jgi:hypothetical protein